MRFYVALASTTLTLSSQICGGWGGPAAPSRGPSEDTGAALPWAGLEGKERDKHTPFTETAAPKLRPKGSI